MDRLIEIKVNGNYLEKDSRFAGVQHEANARSLHITFDAGWDGYAKTVTFWNALNENPVNRTLTADLLDSLAEDTRVYTVPIPGEPMQIAGEMTFVIDGYIVEPFVGDRAYLTASFKIDGTDDLTLCLSDHLVPEEHAAFVSRKILVGNEAYTIVAAGYKGDSEHTILTLDRAFEHPAEGAKLYPGGGKRQRSVSDKLVVKPAPMALGADEPTDPAPTQAEQLQVQIDTILDDMQEQAVRVETAAEHAEASEGIAQGYADNAYGYSQDAKQHAENALQSENFANGFMQDAQFAAEDAAASRDKAIEAQKAAQASEENAAIYRTGAYENAVIANNAANSAYENALIAKDARTAAETAAGEAQTAAADAKASKQSAAESAAYAGSAKDYAQTMRDETIRHKTDAQNAAQEAIDAAARAGEIAGGDITAIAASQVAAHNSSATAHADIRAAIAEASGTVVVTFSSEWDGLVADKTLEEVLALHTAGKTVLAQCPSYGVHGLPLTFVNVSMAVFSLAFNDRGNYSVYTFVLSSDGTVGEFYDKFPTTAEMQEALNNVGGVIVTVSNSAPDKTMGDILTAYESGKTVLMKSGTSYYPLIRAYESSGTCYAFFGYLYSNSNTPSSAALVTYRLHGARANKGTLTSFTEYPIMKGGGTMTGNLTLKGDPTEALHAATKQYVDAVDTKAAAAQSAADGKAPKAHAVNATTYGIGTSGVYGHVKISDKTDSTSGASAGIAASPAAVKAAYDLAKSASDAAGAASALSRFQSGLGNEYVWSKKKYSTVSGKTTEITLGTSSVNNTISYSSTVEFVNGGIQLVNPQSIGSFSLYNGSTKLAGMYFRFPNGYESYSSSTIYYVSPGTACAQAGNLLYVSASPQSAVEESFGYVNSPDLDAYPIDDGYIYTALGQIGNKAQIATGSYIGTGTYGRNNQTKLTFEFEPKMLVICGLSNSTDGFMAVLYPKICGFMFQQSLGSQAGSYAYNLASTFSGNTVAWWNEANANNQMNLSGVNYEYIAIG